MPQNAPSASGSEPNRWLVLLVFAVLGLVAYWPGLAGKRFADDFYLVFNPLPSNPFVFFVERNPQHPFAYRPIETASMILVQQQFGNSTVPIHVGHLLLHILLAWLVYLWMMQQQYGARSALLGGLFMTVAPTAASAVLGCDTLSQVGSAFFGCTSLWLLQHALGSASRATIPDVPRRRAFAYGLSLVGFALALLSKEASVAFIAALGWVALLEIWSGRNGWQRLTRIALVLAPFVVVLGIYFHIRGTVIGAPGPGFHEGRLGMHLGMGTLRNVALFISAAILPISTVDVFVAMAQRDFLMLAPLLGSGIVLGLVILAGVVRSPWRRQALAVAVASLAVLGPMTLFNHISELYVYNGLPLLAVLAGLGLGSVFDWVSAKSSLRAVAVCALVLLVLGQILADRQKATMMAFNGQQMAALTEAILPYAAKVPPQGELVLVYDKNPLDYSVFRMSGLWVFESGTDAIHLSLGRYDFTTRLVTRPQLESQPPSGNAIVLELKDGAVVPLAVPAPASEVR